MVRNPLIVFAFENRRTQFSLCHLQFAVNVATGHFTAEDMKQVGAKSLLALLHERSEEDKNDVASSFFASHRRQNARHRWFSSTAPRPRQGSPDQSVKKPARRWTRNV